MPFACTARMAATVREEMVCLLVRRVPSTSEATRWMGGREGGVVEVEEEEEEEAKQWVVARGGKEEGASHAMVVGGRMALRGILLVAAAAAEARGRRSEAVVMIMQRGRRRERQCIRLVLGWGMRNTSHACPSGMWVWESMSGWEGGSRSFVFVMVWLLEDGGVRGDAMTSKDERGDRCRHAGGRSRS